MVSLPYNIFINLFYFYAFAFKTSLSHLTSCPLTLVSTPDVLFFWCKSNAVSQIPQYLRPLFNEKHPLF